MPDGVTKITLDAGEIYDLTTEQSLAADEEYYLINLSSQPIYYTELVSTATATATSPRIPLRDGEESGSLVVATGTKFWMWSPHAVAEVSLVRAN